MPCALPLEIYPRNFFPVLLSELLSVRQISYNFACSIPGKFMGQSAREIVGKIVRKQHRKKSVGNLGGVMEKSPAISSAVFLTVSSDL